MRKACLPSVTRSVTRMCGVGSVAWRLRDLSWSWSWSSCRARWDAQQAHRMAEACMCVCACMAARVCLCVCVCARVCLSVHCARSGGGRPAARVSNHRTRWDEWIRGRRLALPRTHQCSPVLHALLVCTIHRDVRARFEPIWTTQAQTPPRAPGPDLSVLCRRQTAS